MQLLNFCEKLYGTQLVLFHFKERTFLLEDSLILGRFESRGGKVILTLWTWHYGTNGIHTFGRSRPGTLIASWPLMASLGFLFIRPSSLNSVEAVCNVFCIILPKHVELCLISLFLLVFYSLWPCFLGICLLLQDSTVRNYMEYCVHNFWTVDWVFSV